MSNTKLPKRNSNPPFHVGALGIFLVMGLIIFAIDWYEDQAISRNQKYVDGVVVCEHPYHWKRMDYVCFQYELDNRLYIGKAVNGGVIANYFPGQKCRIVYDGENPKHARITNLLPDSGNAMLPSNYEGEVILLNGGCSCK
jgi:hypothetical protein